MKVALVTEGTYPVHPGGVSEWCDQLVRHLPEVAFEVVALSGSGREPAAYRPPRNVATVRRIGLWARPPRARPLSGFAVERFTGAYLYLLESVLRDGPHAPEWFESAVRTMHELAREGSLTAALRSQLAVEVLLDVWSRAPVPGAGTTGPLTLADALAAPD
jgi:polysaccharide biosynthesis protein PelF